MDNAGRYTRAVGGQHQFAAGTVYATEVAALAAALDGERAALGRYDRRVDGRQVAIAVALGGVTCAALPAVHAAGGAVAKRTGIDSLLDAVPTARAGKVSGMATAPTRLGCWVGAVATT